MTKDTYSAIPKRGSQPIINKLRGYEKVIKKDGKVVRKFWVPSILVSDPEGTKYCLKLDVRKYYPSIVHDVLKKRFRELFKDEELLWLLDEIIDSISTCPYTEENDAGYRNTVGNPWKPMDIPKFVYDCKNVGTMIINKEKQDFESKQTIKLPEEEWVYVKNALPPIVTEEEWALIEKIHKERIIATGSDKRGKGKKVSGYSFSGKLICGECGAPYWRKQRTTKEEYWVCSTKQQKGRKTRKRDAVGGKAGELNPVGCDNENISYNSLMEIMQIISERLQANTEVIKADMVNWLTSLKKQLQRANGGATEAELKKEELRKDRLLDALLDGVLTKEEYSKKATAIDTKITEIKKEMLANRNSIEDIAEIDRVLANIDEEIATYLDENNQLKVDFILEHLESVEIFPDRVVVMIPLFSEGMVVYKSQYVSGEKRCR